MDSSVSQPPLISFHYRNPVFSMIIFGVILLVIGLIAHLHVLFVVGVLILIVGGGLALAGSMGRAIGGRRHYY